MDELLPEQQDSDPSNLEERSVDGASATNETTQTEKNSPQNSEDPSNENQVTNETQSDEEAPYGGSLSLARIQSLVSMTTPRDGGQPGLMGQVPPFVEFDLSIDGFGCLFLPSLFPQSIDQVQYN